MPKIQPTPQAKELCKRLNENGIDAKLEYWDGHKHVDIAILDSKLYIEIDGVQHYIDPKKIEADILRDQYSELNGFATVRFPRLLFENHLDRIAQAVIQVVEKRKKLKTILGK